MNKVEVKMQNCFGISQLNYTFDFSNTNVIAVYARNGLMKTSFLKTFQKIREEKTSEIRDEIFGINGFADITVDGSPILAENIFVIKSFESSYESNITPLLIKDSIKVALKDVLIARDKVFKALEKYSELKIKKTLGGKVVFELENTLINDFLFEENSFLINLPALASMSPDFECSDVAYASIFDTTVMKKINSREFQSKISDFNKKSEEIYASYSFLEKGQFTLPKLKDVKKSLEKDNFFRKKNQVLLAGNIAIADCIGLEEKISEIESSLRAVPEFQAIEAQLSDVKGINLRDIIENHPEIISYLKTDALARLRTNLWLSYFKSNDVLFQDLLSKYIALADQVDQLSLDDTTWKNALRIFEKRFSVPYKMKITNLKGAIMGESIPRVEFSFTKGKQTVRLSRDRLEELDTLSQGEKRALYLLNIIFDIEQVRTSGKETLFIIDDIADSFDYKNKYAIIEYLYELSGNGKFYLIILSHNFDFYRTISSRLWLQRQSRLCAERTDIEIKLVEEHYQNQPFEYWKQNPCSVNVLALIPFVRNLVEYGKERHAVSQESNKADYKILTSLLHKKNNTYDVRFSDLQSIYSEYLGVTNYNDDIKVDDKVISVLYSCANSITSTNADLEYKIILAIAIRLLSEEFMISQLKQYSGLIRWKEGKQQFEGSSVKYLEIVDEKPSQTRELLNGFLQFGDISAVKLIEEVNIMTPENIHLNSFMYEPILDMDIVELISLYERVKELS